MCEVGAGDWGQVNFIDLFIVQRRRLDHSSGGADESNTAGLKPEGNTIYLTFLALKVENDYLLWFGNDGYSCLLL